VGKSTLMKIMAGLDKEFSTARHGRPRARRLAFICPQEPTLEEKSTVRDNVMLGVKVKKTQFLDRYKTSWR